MVHPHLAEAADARAMTTRQQAFTLSGYHGTPTPGTATIQKFERRERWGRALRGLGTWWGAALASVFVPVAHFILVPSFLGYGVWQFAARLGTTELVTEAKGICPDCGAAQDLTLAAQWRTPQPVTCSTCRRGLRLSSTDTATPGVTGSPELLRH